MRAALLRLLRRESGATAIEYALVAILISVAAFGVTQQIGTSVTGFFAQVANSF
ncbi:MAG: Flp family type IVb pilin [Alphaproteobacteria bacterium]|nr:Flp family type IVb pilin [Alphaproteobacteria bacterium]